MAKIEHVDISEVMRRERVVDNQDGLISCIEQLSTGDAVKITYESHKEACNARDKARRFLRKRNLREKYIYHQTGMSLYIGKVKG